MIYFITKTYSKAWVNLGGRHCTMESVLALHPAALGLILSVTNKFSLDVAKIYWRHITALVSGQWRSLIVDRTHLVLLDNTTKKVWANFESLNLKFLSSISHKMRRNFTTAKLSIFIAAWLCSVHALRTLASLNQIQSH